MTETDNRQWQVA